MDVRCAVESKAHNDYNKEIPVSKPDTTHGIDSIITVTTFLHSCGFSTVCHAQARVTIAKVLYIA